ncbi:class I adenylate-forming enzyme family protein [Nocardioides sp.]|uniref:class I adenylate-forming enzyme family protein n=1 Tax=Nocardioides sp. TaxID=35761 RepID=UPI00271FDFFC|nr:AMP-binding protein [Nocardioides sp.]MDO9455476.1 AMP-binding protein [Nocardioides sp.]
MPGAAALTDAVAGPAALVASAAADHPDKLAVVESRGRSLTWAGLDDEVGRVATGLAAAGVVAGYRIIVLTSNRLEFVTTYLGILRAQAVAVPLSPGASAREVARVVADCGARMIVADADTVTTVRAAAALVDQALAGGETTLAQDVPAEVLARLVKPRVVVIGTTLQPGERSYDHLRADTAREVPALHDPERIAALLYTSGTTGLPRAAMLSHRALAANIEQVASVDPPMIHGDDVVLGVLPLFHVYGLNAVLGAVLRSRAKLVLADRFDAQGTLDLIDDEAISVVPVAPPVFAHWRDVDLADRLGPVRVVLSGSAPVSAAVVEEFVARTGIPVHQGYGLTEAAPVVTSTLCSVAAPAGSVGATLAGIDLRLVDESGAVVPEETGDPGEIQVRGDNLFSGYWPDGADGPDSDGWWSTGDVGYVDGNGDVFLVDRVKELVIVSGFNVYPVEVERVVAEVDDVADVAVIGVADDTTGEAVVAYVVAPGAHPVVVEVAVRAACESSLARFKVPSRIEVVDRLPHGVTGKAQKGRLRGLERRRALGLLE